jgi:fimbrial chaperone protein
MLHPPYRLRAATRWIAAIFLLSAAATAFGQALSVAPVNISLEPNQKSAILSLTNRSESDMSIQIRVFAWNQTDNLDQLTETNAVIVSPPLATIAPGSNQVIRLLLRHPAIGREDTYRILADQIPSAGKAGTVQIVLRLSIPVFAEPEGKTAPHLQFHLESDGQKVFLVGVNDGTRHDALRETELTTSDGRKLKTDPGVLPYILAGVTRRWPIVAEGVPLKTGEALRLKAKRDSGSIDQEVRYAPAP